MTEGKCRVCGTGSLNAASHLADSQGDDVALLHCEHCDAIQPLYSDLHVDAEDTNSETKWQSQYHESLWTLNATESVEDVVTDLRSMVSALADTLGPPSADRRILELGAGRGALVRALLDLGYHAKGCEPSAGLVTQARTTLRLTENELAQQDAMSFLESEKSLGTPVHCIFIWHVLEHLEDPVQTLKCAYDRLTPGGCILAQVPLLTPEYIFPAHLFFLSSGTFRWVASQLPGARCDIWRDDTNLYLTAKITKGEHLGEKPAAGNGAVFTDVIAASHANRRAAALAAAKLQSENDELRIGAKTPFFHTITSAPPKQPSETERRIADLEEINKMLEEKISTLLQSLADATASANQRATNISELALKVDKLEAENRYIQALHETKEHQLAEANALLASLKATNAKMALALEGQKNEAALLSDQLARTLEQKATSEAVADSAIRQRESMATKLAALEQSHAAAVGKLHREYEMRAALTKTVNELDIVRHESQAEIIGLQAQLDESKKVLTEYLANQEAHDNQAAYKLVSKLNFVRPVPKPTAATPQPALYTPSEFEPRSMKFRDRNHNRYWWHRVERTGYVPLLYAHLSPVEWALMEAWFTDTEKQFQSTGEANIPPLSLLLGLISGNGISKVVQCGHYVGYSSLILGFLLRHQNAKKCLFSIDIDPMVTEYTQDWINRAELNEQVQLHIGDSANEESARAALDYLGGAPQIVFIDSSHQYAHTLKELDLWYGLVAEGGFILLHDTSAFAATFDSSGGGGVLKASTEWCEANGVHPLAINSFVEGGSPGDVPYLDGCGITIIQKTPRK